MNRKQRRALSPRCEPPQKQFTWESLVRALEELGPVLWEPGREGIAGWAVCPGCGQRELWIEFTPDEDAA